MTGFNAASARLQLEPKRLSGDVRFGKARTMKQTLLLRDIEAKEARSVCLLAGEDPARVTANPILTAAQRFKIVSLWAQLYLGAAAECLSRRQRSRTHATSARMRLR